MDEEILTELYNRRYCLEAAMSYVKELASLMDQEPALPEVIAYAEDFYDFITKNTKSETKTKGLPHNVVTFTPDMEF